MTVNDFVGLMDVPLKGATSDIDIVSRKTRDFDALSIGQANSLLQTPAFTRWLSQPEPGLLLVEACLEKSNKVSAMSLFCAHLSQSILENIRVGGG